MATALLGLGSNLGDRDAHLRRAVEAIRALPGVTAVRVSPFYDTAPVGPQDQGRFLNAALRLETTLPPRLLLERMLEIEARLGRPAREARRRWGPREVDLDLLLYDERVIDEPGLTVPHPHLHQRRFVLEPLADLEPSRRHPVLDRTVAELLAGLEQEVTSP